jgi:hypothetical protein
MSNGSLGTVVGWLKKPWLIDEVPEAVPIPIHTTQKSFPTFGYPT